MQYLSKITNSHSCGHDNISSSTLKCIAHEICECLTLIINQSITTGIFPENLKIAKVVPIYKKSSQIKNYRPLSVLPVISKMHSQLVKYLRHTNFYQINNMGSDRIDLRNLLHLS